MTAKQSLSGQRESQAKAFPEKAEKGKAFAGAHEIPENQESQSRKVRAYLKKAASDKVFPGCVLACGSPGEGKVSCFWAGQRGLSRNREPVSSDLVYDLASITKVLSTTFLLAIAVNEGLVSLGSRLDGLGWPVPGSHKRLAIVDLLAHSSGLPAWRPYYLDKRLAERDRLIETILNEPKVSSVGGLTLYSDLNFILLGFVLEQVWDKDLKTLFSEKIAAPLGLVATGFRPDPLRFQVAPTEDRPRLGGPLDWPGAKVMGPVPLGRVHDDNAAFLGGQAGHAGLFGTAPEAWIVIAHWASCLANGPGALVSSQVMEAFLERRASKKGSPRAAGFDIGQGPIEGARGHLGYTGGSLWWDPGRDRAFVLLSNRVHPTARESRMEEFRRGLAEILW